MVALVGEIGLDGSPQYRKHWNRQTEVFVRALTAAERVGGRVVSIHSRRAANEFVSCLEQHTTRARLLPGRFLQGAVAIVGATVVGIRAGESADTRRTATACPWRAQAGSPGAASY